VQNVLDRLSKIGDARDILTFSSKLSKGKRAGLAFCHCQKTNQLHRRILLY